jgi:hypothetical protein
MFWLNSRKELVYLALALTVSAVPLVIAATLGNRPSLLFSAANPSSSTVAAGRAAAIGSGTNLQIARAAEAAGPGDRFGNFRLDLILPLKVENRRTEYVRPTTSLPLCALRTKGNVRMTVIVGLRWRPTIACAY